MMGSYERASPVDPPGFPFFLTAWCSRRPTTSCPAGALPNSTVARIVVSPQIGTLISDHRSTLST